MPDYETILLTSSDSICRLVLNRPDKRNALNPTVVAELRAALAADAASSETRVVLISGAGSDFCSGVDLASLGRVAQAGILENLDDARSLGELFTAIRKHPHPVIAAVRGRALAGGCGLATACDVVLVSESASFGYPEVNIGFVPAIVSAIIRRSLPEKRAFDLLTTGNIIPARTARDIGLITHVFPDDTFDAEVERYVAALAAKSASAISLTKNALYAADGLSFEAAIEAGARTNVLARLTDDCRRGIEKFLRS